MSKGRKRSGKWGGRNVFVGVSLLILCFFVLERLAHYTMGVKHIPYSEFAQKVERGQIAEVTMAGPTIRCIPKEDPETEFQTVVPQHWPVWDMLRRHSVVLKAVNVSSPFNIWYLIFGFSSFLMLMWMLWYVMRQMRNSGGMGGNNIFTMGKSRARLFMPSAIKDTFESVAGADGAKEELQDLVNFLKNPEKYKRLGAKVTRGVLLEGAPGNGKTLLARAVAGEANCPFFSVSGSDFIEVFVGVGASRVRDLFVQARKYSPSIVFIDEIDAVGRHRGSGLGGGHDEREQTLNQLLTEMDGFQTSTSSVIVIAATNRPDVLDHALLRPGRFDKRVQVPYPDLASRKKILEVHAKGVKIDPKVDFQKLARGTPGFSGADLANLINEAALIASKSDQTTVMVADFEEARDKMLLGKEWKTSVPTREEQEMTAYHEAGHALVTLLMPEQCDPLHKITITPRGSTLGVTHSMPEREKFMKTEPEMRAAIMMGLGGRVAEELVFKVAATGAYSDFKRTSEIARQMVCSYGMTTTLGAVIYGQGQGDFVYSQKTAELIDKEVLGIMNKAHTDTVELLTKNRPMLNKLATELLEKETLNASDIYELLGIEPRVDHSFDPV